MSVGVFRKRRGFVIVVGAALLASAGQAFAQSKTITGKTKSITAEVEAIETASREVTVKKPDGTYDVWYIPATLKKFDTLKIGDKVTARYYENMVVAVKPPSEPAVNAVNAAVTRNDQGHAGTVAHQRTITATISAIDMATPSITFTGPNDWKYTTRVEDKAALAQVKVGDRVDITWTEATVLSIGSGK